MPGQAVADGRLTDEKRLRLEEVREQMGLTKEASERIIASISNQRVGSSLQVGSGLGSRLLGKLGFLKQGVFAGKNLCAMLKGKLLPASRQGTSELESAWEGPLDEAHALCPSMCV